MTQKDIHIKIGNVEFSTANLPEKGLDITQFNEATRKILNIFDTDNKKGILSKEELTKMVSLFASYDNDGNGEIDDETKNEEMKNLQDYLAKQAGKKEHKKQMGKNYQETMKTYEQTISTYKQALELATDPNDIEMIKMMIRQTEALRDLYKQTQESAETLDNISVSVSLLDNSIKDIAEDIKLKMEISARNLEYVDSNIYKDSEGNYFKWKEGNFTALEGVISVHKNGSYEKGEAVAGTNITKITTYDFDNEETSVTFEGDNTTPDQAARSFGWVKEYSRYMGITDKIGDFFRGLIGKPEPKGQETDYYIDTTTGNRYRWNEEKKIFEKFRPVDLNMIKDLDTSDGTIVFKY